MGTLRFCRSLFLILVASAGAGLGCSSNVTDLGPSQANPLDSEETSLLNAFNAFRQGQGLPSVTSCKVLNVSASAHADDMRDQNYLADDAPDGSTVRTRGCDAGYTPACSTSAGVAELVASGVDIGANVFKQWQSDTTTQPVLVNASLIVVGIGRSEGEDQPDWAMDLGSTADPSCTN